MGQRQTTKRNNKRAILMAVAMPVAGMLGLGAKSASATTVTWDTGNGNWDTNAGTGQWAATATYANGDNVVFGTGSGASGTALVNVDLSAVSPANFTVTNISIN